MDMDNHVWVAKSDYGILPDLYLRILKEYGTIMCDGKRSWRPAEGPIEEIQKHDLEVVKEMGDSFRTELQSGNNEIHQMVRRVGSGR